jgi:arsenite methyltransferase
VIALDFLPEMLTRTANAASEAGLSNVEPLEGELEASPLPDDSVDLIISNGGINLSAREARVMAECARVLKPGGEMGVSDLSVEQDGLPPETLTQPAAWGWLRGRRPDRERLLAQASAGRAHRRPGAASAAAQHRRLRALPAVLRRRDRTDAQTHSD